MRHLGPALASLVTLAGLTLVAAPSEAAGPVQGCPYGAVCVYPQDAGWNNGQPSLVFWSYGGHDLNNQVGHHHVLNNQHNAIAIACATYGGCADAPGRNAQITGLGWTHEESSRQGESWANLDLTPVNSIDLEQQGP